MNEAMHEANIREYAQKAGRVAEGNFIYALVNPSNLAYLGLGGAATFLTENYILLFTKEHILVINVDLKGDFTGAHEVVPRGNIESIACKKGMMQSTLTLKSGGHEIKFKAPNFIAVAKWQKPNLERLVQNNWMA